MSIYKIPATSLVCPWCAQPHQLDVVMCAGEPARVRCNPSGVCGTLILQEVEPMPDGREVEPRVVIEWDKRPQ